MPNATKTSVVRGRSSELPVETALITSNNPTTPPAPQQTIAIGRIKSGTMFGSLEMPPPKRCWTSAVNHIGSPIRPNNNMTPRKPKQITASRVRRSCRDLALICGRANIEEVHDCQPPLTGLVCSKKCCFGHSFVLTLTPTIHRLSNSVPRRTPSAGKQTTRESDPSRLWTRRCGGFPRWMCSSNAPGSMPISPENP